MILPLHRLKDNCSSRRGKHGSTGSTSFGYSGGGTNHLGSLVSSIGRIDFSNDTATAPSKGPLSQTREELTGVSPQANGITAGTLYPPAFRVDWQYGYIAQGYVPTPIASSISRIDFSNDGILQKF